MNIRLRIKTIHLSNWRSVRQVEIECFNLLMLIGKNSHGKSNILFAILYFFGKIQLQAQDFYNQEDYLSVAITFDTLTRDERQEFQQYLDKDGLLTIRKHAWSNGLLEKYLSPANKEFGSAETLGRFAAFINVIFIPASRHSPESVNMNGELPLFQFLRTMVNNLLNMPVVIDYIPLEITHKNPLNVQTPQNEILHTIESALNHEMAAWGISFRLQGELKPGDGSLHLHTNICVDNGEFSDLSRKGHGFLRALIFSIIRAWVLMLQHKQPMTVGEKQIIMLIEEPELFLHPQAQKELLSSLEKLAESGLQVVFTTHSSFFIDLSIYKSICIAHRDGPRAPTTIQQWTNDLFPVHEDVRNFNMSYWINPDRGELFFAKKVILVEGPTEKVVLPKLAKKAGIFHHEYTLIDCSGKSNMPLYISLLNKYRIPYVVVYDSDQHLYRKRHARETAAYLSRAIEEIIDPSLGSSVVFESDIEDELGMIETELKNKPFSALSCIADQDFFMSERFANKLFLLYK